MRTFILGMKDHGSSSNPLERSPNHTEELLGWGGTDVVFPGLELLLAHSVEVGLNDEF